MFLHVSQQGRNTQGVRLINLSDEEHLVGLAQVQEPTSEEDSEVLSEDSE